MSMGYGTGCKPPKTLLAFCIVVTVLLVVFFVGAILFVVHGTFGVTGVLASLVIAGGFALVILEVAERI